MDPRIAELRAAAEAMKRGDFQVEIPVSPEHDEIDGLAEALAGLRETVREKFEQINSLARVTEVVAGGVLLEEVLDLVFDSFRPLIPYDRIGLALLDQEGKTIEARWARSDAPEIKLGGGYSEAVAETSLGEVLSSGQPRILNDLEAYLRERPSSHSTRLVVEEGMKSSLTCPLMVNDQAMGCLFFSSTEASTYRDAHVEIFQQIAGQLAMTLEKSRLYQDLLDLSELKDRFLGMAAHDLRQPLGTLKGLLGLMLHEHVGEVGPAQKQLLNRMDRSCGAMLELVETLLDVQAIEKGQLVLQEETSDLLSVVLGCVESHSALAEAKGISLEWELPEDLPVLEVDSTRICQVISNLVINALKFSHPGTRVLVSAEQRENEAAISVMDQGQGIPADELPRLFTDFGRTSVRPTGGEPSTGLGLAIVKRIVDAHGGRIEVTSEVGKGSVFTVLLPVDRGDR